MHLRQLLVFVRFSFLSVFLASKVNLTKSRMGLTFEGLPEHEEEFVVPDQEEFMDEEWVIEESSDEEENFEVQNVQNDAATEEIDDNMYPLSDDDDTLYPDDDLGPLWCTCRAHRYGMMVSSVQKTIFIQVIKGQFKIPDLLRQRWVPNQMVSLSLRGFESR